jgi:hypothetical protein
MIRSRWCVRIAAVLSVGYATAIAAQDSSLARSPFSTRSAFWVGSPLDEYFRVLQLTGAAPLTSRMLRPNDVDMRSIQLSDTGELSRNPWRARFGANEARDRPRRFSAEVYHPIVRMIRNSDVPFGTNDGAMWAGRGISTSIDVGGAVRYGPLTVRLAPSLVYAENRGFRISPLFGFGATYASPYSDPALSGWIDRPQRFGEKPFWRLDPGQSAVQLDLYGVRVGASTENMWWGPGVENSLLVTNNASGFPHVTLGTSRPVNVWLGNLEVLYTVGWLQQSDFWRTAGDTMPTRRWVNALALTLEPRGAPGLYIGIGRVYYDYIPDGGISFGDLTDIFEPFTKKQLVTPDKPFGDDRGDQMLSLFGRWVFPQVGFEVYGEWGRNDHSWDTFDLVQELDHSRAYVLGFAKAFGNKPGLLMLRGEIASLGQTLTMRLRPVPFWYAHHAVQQGFTQRGQIIGAGIGIGSDQQSFSADWYRRWGRVGGFLTRVRDNSDMYYRLHDDPTGSTGAFLRHDVLFGLGVRSTVFVGPVDLTVSAMRHRQFNRYMEPQNMIMNTHLKVNGQFRLP